MNRKLALVEIAGAGLVGLTARATAKDDDAREDDIILVTTPTSYCENGYSQTSGVTLTCDQMEAIAAPIVNGGTTVHGGITWTAGNPTDNLCLFNFSGDVAVFTNNLVTEAAIECTNPDVTATEVQDEKKGNSVAMALDIEIRYFDSCPSWQLAADRLREALQAEGLEAEVTYTTVETAEDAKRLRFIGSPSILINGLDPFLPADARVGLACRMFRTGEGLQGSPTVDQLRSVLSQEHL